MFRVLKYHYPFQFNINKFHFRMADRRDSDKGKDKELSKVTDKPKTPVSTSAPTLTTAPSQMTVTVSLQTSQLVFHNVQKLCRQTICIFLSAKWIDIICPCALVKFYRNLK